MDLLDTIIGAGGGNDVLHQLARRSQLSPDQTMRAVSEMIPALTEGVRKNASQKGGMGALMWALSGGRHQQYLDNPKVLDDEATVSDGNKILGHLLGGKDASREVAAKVANDTGLDSGTIKKMLPLVAAVAMGALSKQAQWSGLMQMFSGGASNLGDAGRGLGMLEGLLGGDKTASAGNVLSGLAKNFLK
ncbi:MAG: DUF937 domain-containing protein [Gammaproteobacteria bacterium]|nr:DUF937 domain-containing protein [Gammaproteobacteria bacterium]